MPAHIEATDYTWWVDGSASVVSGHGTNTIEINFSPYFRNGPVRVGRTLSNGCYTESSLSVESDNSSYRVAEAGASENRDGGSAYPNPFTDAFNLEIAPSEQPVKVSISNSEGQVFYTKTVSASPAKTSLRVKEDFPLGVYIVQTSAVDDVKTFRVVKVQ